MISPSLFSSSSKQQSIADRALFCPHPLLRLETRPRPSWLCTSRRSKYAKNENKREYKPADVFCEFDKITSFDHCLPACAFRRIVSKSSRTMSFRQPSIDARKFAYFGVTRLSSEQSNPSSEGIPLNGAIYL